MKNPQKNNNKRKEKRKEDRTMKNNLYFKNYNDNAPISAFITNLGKYNEGQLIGQWATLPLNNEEINQLYKNIGINGEYEETFNTDYNINIKGLDYNMLGYNCGEYASIKELNALAEAINNLEEYDRDKLGAILEYYGASGIDEILQFIEDIDDWALYEDVNDNYDIGNYYVNEMCCFDLDKMGDLANYIDYEALGRDIAINADGGFTSYGFIERL